MSLDLMQLVCDVKYITRGYVVVGYAHVSVVDVIQEMKISNTLMDLSCLNHMRNVTIV